MALQAFIQGAKGLLLLGREHLLQRGVAMRGCHGLSQGRKALDLVQGLLDAVQLYLFLRKA